MKKIIKTTKAPLPIGPYNQAVVIGNMVYLSGQIALDLKTNNVIAGGVAEQAKCVIGHIRTILEEAGSSLEKTIKATVFLKNMNDFSEMNTVYEKFFKKTLTDCILVARKIIEI